MIKIQKTVSLEPMTSRVPSIWPAYKDNVLYYFDDASLKKRDYKYPSNYGMIPLKLSFSSSTYDGIECSNEGCKYTMSFERLSKWYAFFKEYNHLLNAGHCSRTYSSATEYYDNEIKNSSIYDLEYGTDRETYVNLDNEFQSKGGNTFYEWITQNIIPTYTISNKYKGYWKRDNLYYPDVIKWIAWLNDRRRYEEDGAYSAATSSADVEHWDCKRSGITDCCDCEEYFNRGGERELSRMKEWYNSLQSEITKIYDVIKSSNCSSCFTPTILESIELHNSLDDLGQFSVMSPEYEVGIDYRTAEVGASANTRSGTTVIGENGNSLILKPNKTGFCFSQYYMEKFFDEDSWDDYTTYYISRNPQDFVSSAYTYYAFDDNNKLYTGMSESAVSASMVTGETYEVKYDGVEYVIIDKSWYPIETTEYGIYDISGNSKISGNQYFVYREKNTSTPYTLINGKKIYAEFYIGTNGSCYYFPFFKEESGYTVDDSCHKDKKAFDINRYQKFPVRGMSDKIVTYINYNDNIYAVSSTNSGLTIGNVEYPIMRGYAYNSDGEIMYLMRYLWQVNSYQPPITINFSNYKLEINRPTLFDSELNPVSYTYDISADKKVITKNKYNPNVKIYSSKEITGQTISKLTDLQVTNKLSDDVGNNIDGIYNDTCRIVNGISSAITYAQPPVDTELELIYQVGNVSFIGKCSLTEEDISSITKNYFIGNIITDMVFYYKDKDGNVVESTKESASTSVSSLSAIKSSTVKKLELSGTTFEDDIYCDITYYIGATLSRESNSPFFEKADGYNYGVEYKETVKFVKTQVPFVLNKGKDKSNIEPTLRNEPLVNGNQYMVYIYKLTQNESEIIDDIYETIYKVPLANFKTEINLITLNDSGITTNFSGYTEMDAFNVVKVSPVYKEEYKLGIATMENIDSDIYIDRGINAAFERHLKLGEVTSLEALINYGNKFFKIMDN